MTILLRSRTAKNMWLEYLGCMGCILLPLYSPKIPQKFENNIFYISRKHLPGSYKIYFMWEVSYELRHSCNKPETFPTVEKDVLSEQLFILLWGWVNVSNCLACTVNDICIMLAATEWYLIQITRKGLDFEWSIRSKSKSHTWENKLWFFVLLAFSPRNFIKKRLISLVST